MCCTMPSIVVLDPTVSNLLSKCQLTALVAHRGMQCRPNLERSDAKMIMDALGIQVERLGILPWDLRVYSYVLDCCLSSAPTMIWFLFCNIFPAPGLASNSEWKQWVIGHTTMLRLVPSLNCDCTPTEIQSHRQRQMIHFFLVSIMHFSSRVSIP